ncbi:MAG TPA: glycosyl hydrolase family protein [Solirubrobacteraceae bacterium]|jgi:hypothetical protein|nr:glycosyl hydrolase family protein [Solirubrobacteraceae bacterium]
MTSCTDIRLGIARGISYGLFGPFEPFVATSRALGAGLVRLYVYWSQVEPRPGLYNWSVVDALLAQVTGDVEVWVTVCASSQWGTRTATDSCRRRRPSASTRTTGGPARLERLSEASASATHGITLGGRTFGTVTDSGRLGSPVRSGVPTHHGGYRVTVPAASALVLTAG